ncbi:MAG: phosphoribosylglycinamide formyltransferase [Halioglobus sp.]|nr:phosphoribosylglycinamide formyltransferase [Halioglobus sp.]
MNSQVLPRLAILISGHGTNLQAFIDACARRELVAHIGIVISNNPKAVGLQRAHNAGLATHTIDHRDFATREEFDQALVNELHSASIDLVVLAGFMRILTPVLVQPFVGRLLNIHPSLLPKYPGMRTHQRALDSGDAEAGATVHFVTQELDGGPPILQGRLPTLPDDTAESLAARVSILEHAMYPLAVRWYLQGRLQLTDNGAVLDGKMIAATGVQYRADAR